MEHYDDDDDDDDVSFAKWMSSFWGHNWIKEDERRLRDHNGSQDASYRQTSLPCSSLYTVNIFILCFQFPGPPRITSSGSHPRRHSLEGQGFRCRTHMRDYRKCLEDGSFKEPLESKRRSRSQIQAFSESFEQQLCFRTKHSLSLGAESRKERNERECSWMEIRPRKKVEERRSSRKEEHGIAYMVPLFEKGPK
ncbi:leukemia NUP98 fusion partner 1 [Rhinolophus ferrumequinum]|uniref:Leukemia NUP98 fusion partner 1 n=1 Tax=Rhinolophus ferrumequinum TaxID=59479 RepID=A0A671E8Y7_RHIFE|nr:leukemia NUP98 fusion partner 1 [Rhinolophus ferrumequinum]